MSFIPTSLKSRDGWVDLLEAQRTEEPHLHQIEPTNHCPYACIMCPRDKHMTRETGFMEMDLYQKVVEEVSGYSAPIKAKEIELFHFGESLLHPNIIEMLEFGSRRDLNMTLSVNAPHLTPQLAERILASQPYRMIISLDGHDDESYRLIRGPAADYQKASQNIQHLISLVEQGRSATKICVRIIRLHANDAFIEQFKSEWEARGIEVEVRPFFPWTEKEMVGLGQVVKYPPFMPCPFSWQYLVVQWDGTVVPCCRDYNGHNALMNARDMTLKEIWNGPVFQAFREQHRTGNYAENYFCRDCMDIFYTEDNAGAVGSQLEACPACLSHGIFSASIKIQDSVELDLANGFIKSENLIVPLNRRQSSLLYLAQRTCCLSEVAHKAGLTEQEIRFELAELLTANMLQFAPRENTLMSGLVHKVAGPIETLPLLWQQSISQFSGEPLLASDEDNSCFNYSDADEIITMLITRLAAEGVGKGDCIVGKAHQHAELFFLFWATTSLGAVFVPIDPELSIEATLALLDRIRPKLVFVDYPGFNAGIANSGQACIVLDDADDLPLEGAQRFSDWIEEPCPAFDGEVSINRDTLAIILFTSGTTGQPKGVELSHASLCRSASLMASTYAWRRNDVLFSLGDFHTMSGLRNPCIATVVAGCSLVLAAPEARANALVVADCISRNRVTLLGTVPALLRQFVRFASRIDQETLTSLRRILCTGSALRPELAAKIREIYQVPVFNYYGLTETTGLCAGVIPGELDRAVGSIGIPLGGLMRIEAADGSPVASGEKGELLIFTENLMLGYFQDQAMTLQVMVEGWYRTGDLAYRDATGHIFLDGRMSDAIKDSRGELVYPQEVETAIEQSALVTACGVCGVTGAEGEEQLVAFIVTEQSVEDEREFFFSLGQIVLKKLGRHRMPSRYVRVEGLPRSGNGKLLRMKLKELL